MLSLTTAFFVAALALFGNIIFGQWNRYRERCGVAAALAGEISAYIKLLDAPNAVANYRKFAESNYPLRQQNLHALPKTPDSHPVFDKVADKIGLLPVKEASDISMIYNLVTSVRIMISHLSDDKFIAADDAIQKAMLLKVAEIIQGNNPLAQDLVERLERISNQSFRCFLCSG